jgi:hypothetical protein
MSESGSSRPRLHLPEAWVEFVLSFVWFAFSGLAQYEKSTGHTEILNQLATILASATYLCGIIYWMICVYRFHQVIAVLTDNTYPISAARAVGFQLIPLYSVYWNFKWPRKLASFIQSRTNQKNVVDMARHHTFTWRRAGHFRGWWHFTMFVRGRPIHQQAARAHNPQGRSASHIFWQLRLSITAGVGAGFVLTLAEGINRLLRSPKTESVHQLVAIAVLSICAILFLDPLVSWLQRVAGHSEEHSVNSAGVGTVLGTAVLLITTVLATTCHGFLHFDIEPDPWEAVVKLLIAFSVPAAITYFWILGSWERPPQATKLGLFAGLSIGAVLVLYIAAMFGKDHGALHLVPGLVSPFAGSALTGRPQDDWALVEKMIGVQLLPLAIAGLAGGLTIDRGWGRSRTQSVAISLVLPVAILALLSIKHVGQGWTMIRYDLAQVVGWGLGLIVSKNSETMLRGTHPAPYASPPVVEASITAL